MTHFGPSNQSSSKLVIVYDADSRLVAAEGNVALAIQQAKYPHSTVLITHGDMDTIGWGAEEGDLMFLALQDQDLHKKQTDAGWNLASFIKLPFSFFPFFF